MNTGESAQTMNQETFAPQIAIGPRVRKSPYFEATLDHGAKVFTIYNHMFMPTLYAESAIPAPAATADQPTMC